MNLWRRLFLPFAAGYFFSYFLRNVNAVIAPDLLRELGIAASDLGLLTSVYLLAFGLAQLPLGMALDHFGARRVESFLLLIAATGCALFAVSTTLPQLALARSVIGLGVSACLMAAFKAFGQSFGPERQVSLNASIMAAGGLGALTASAPLAWLITQIGWRSVFFILAATGVVVAAGIFSVPEGENDNKSQKAESFKTQWDGLRAIFFSRAFWQYAPPATLIIGGFMAFHGLWGIPWLMTFSGFSRAVAAHHMFLMGLGMLIGFLTLAFGVAPLAKRGISADALLKTGLGLGQIVMALIIFASRYQVSELLWFCLGLVFAVGNLVYALLQKNYPIELAGRANTALNSMVFFGAFSIQWGFGAAVDACLSGGMAPATAYQVTLTGLLVLQAASWLWLVSAKPIQ